MAFKIFNSSEKGIDLVNLKDESSQTLISIAPKFGAMLHGFSINTNDGPANIIDHYTDAEDLDKNLATSFKSSKLSPFVCRIQEGKYLYDGVEFEFPEKFLDGSAIHGLLYNKPFFRVTDFADDEQASVTFKYNYKEDDEGYPFNYRCEIRYALKPQNILQVQTTIINLDDLPIPIADGWHPYFKLGGKINDWQLYFNADAMLEFDDKLIPTGHVLEYNEFNEEKIIGDTVLDNCFILNIDEGHAACTLRNDSRQLQLNFFPDSSYPYLQIFTPPHRNSIAIENLSAAPDAFNNKMGLLMLAARHTNTFTVHYQLTGK